jgi:Tfp pilus assembly protein PilX
VSDSRRQQGSALLIVMLVMAMMGIVGFAALEAVTRDQRVAGFMKRKQASFYAAEAGVTAALHALRTTEEPTFTGSTVGDTASFPEGLPTYSLDTDSGAPTQNLGVGPLEGMNLEILENGEAKFVMRYWDVKVKGQAAGGTLSRIQFASGTLEAN